MNATMPICAGFDMALKIRQLPLHSPPKIIMSMAYGDCEVNLYSSRQGFDGYLNMPSTISSLFDAIVSAFGTSGEYGNTKPDTDFLADTINKISGCRVLVAEDNDMNQQIAYELLTGAGVIVTVVGSGDEALDLVHEASFDLVFMDVQMPVMDGCEATRLIRRDPLLQSLPIIAMTAHATPQDRELCLGAGMNDYLTKPTSRRKLLTMVEKWAGHADEMQSGQSVPQILLTSETCSFFKQEISGIFQEAGLALYGGNQILFMRLLRQFLQTRSGAAKEIRTELANDRLEEARRIAHTMKSLSGAIAAEELSRSACALEMAISHQESDLWNGLLDDFELLLNKVVQGIGVSFSSMQDTSPVKDNTTHERSMAGDLAELRRLLDVDVGMAMLLRDEIHPRFATGDEAEEFQLFEERLATFDVEGAKASVGKMMARLCSAL